MFSPVDSIFMNIIQNKFCCKWKWHYNPVRVIWRARLMDFVYLRHLLMKRYRTQNRSNKWINNGLLLHFIHLGQSKCLQKQKVSNHELWHYCLVLGGMRDLEGQVTKMYLLPWKPHAFLLIIYPFTAIRIRPSRPPKCIHECWCITQWSS